LINTQLSSSCTARLAEIELDMVEKDRTIASLQDDVEVLRETNRSLVRECGLNSSERLPFN
jgi:hypothetical protein